MLHSGPLSQLDSPNPQLLTRADLSNAVHGPLPALTLPMDSMIRSNDDKDHLVILEQFEGSLITVNWVVANDYDSIIRRGGIGSAKDARNRITIASRAVSLS